MTTATHVPAGVELSEPVVITHTGRSVEKASAGHVVVRPAGAQGAAVSLHDLLQSGPAVVTFYRGGWCPYCNLELRAFQQVLPEIEAAGATLVAITPELPDESLSTKERDGLKFEVLRDKNSAYGRELGVVFTLTKELVGIYQSFGIEVEKHNGEGQFDLPLPATFIVNADGTITCAFVAVDYTLRVEPSDVVEELKKLVHSPV